MLKTFIAVTEKKSENRTSCPQYIMLFIFIMLCYRAHLNDLENLPVFWMLGLLFILTGLFNMQVMLIHSKLSFMNVELMKYHNNSQIYLIGILNSPTLSLQKLKRQLQLFTQSRYSTDPSEFAAKVCMYGFTAARYVHSVAYLFEVQPYRALGFGVGQLINIYMAIRIVCAFWQKY